MMYSAPDRVSYQKIGNCRSPWSARLVLRGRVGNISYRRDVRRATMPRAHVVYDTLTALSPTVLRLRAALLNALRLRNDLDCVGWGVKLYSNSNCWTLGTSSGDRLRTHDVSSSSSSPQRCADSPPSRSTAVMGLLQLRYEHDSSTIRARFGYNTLQHATRFFVRSRTRSIRALHENQW